MIVTELYNGQGFGNQLFAYVTTRMLAHKLGYVFGIMHPERWKGYEIMDVDMGKKVIGGESPEGGPPTSLPEGITHYYREHIHAYDMSVRLGTNLQLTDRKLFEIKDNTKIDGIFQSEDYFYNNFNLVKQWLKIKPEVEHYETYGDNICVIYFRGGDNIGNAGCWMPRSFWLKAIERMVEYNSKMEFVIVTDDPNAANKMLPEYPAYHKNIAWDFVAHKNCKHMITGASTFACFPLWMSDTLEYCIAPKYWFDHNRSHGWWALGSSIYSFVSHYMDREGNLFTVDECKEEWEKYKKETNLYGDDV